MDISMWKKNSSMAINRMINKVIIIVPTSVIKLRR